MSTEKSATILPSIRTLAKDQARIEQGDKASPTASTAPNSTAAPKATIVGGGESRIYQAPTAKDIVQPPKREIPKPPVPKNEMPKASPPKLPEKETLRPLTRPKITPETTIVVDNEDAASATIIRDTKHGRFRLFPAIGASLKSWFEGIKDKYFTKKAPKYTVPETTRRKGVIQKATSKTGKLTTFDNTSLQARIKERESRAIPKTPTTTWTANTEPGYALLEAPEEEKRVTNVHIVPRKNHPATPKIEPQPVVAKTETLSLPKAPRKPTIIIASETEPIMSAHLPEPEPTPEPIEQEPKPPVRQPYITEETPRVTRLKPASLREWLFTLNTNLIALGVVGVVITLIIFVVTGYTILEKNMSTITVTAVPNHPALIEAPLQVVYADGFSKDQLIQSLTNNLTAGGRPDILQLTFATKDTGALLPAHAVMSNLLFRTNTPFARSLNALYFGAAADGTPFLLLKTTDDTTALGGMLSWEASLYEDLIPIFRTSPQDSVPIYKDRVLGTVDIRAQLSPTGEVVLAYNEPVKNVIIITTSVATLEMLLPLIK